MLDFSAYKIRKFEIKTDEKTLNLLPPKLSQVSVINEFAKKLSSTGVNGDDLSEIALLIFNRNDRGEKIDREYVEELSYDAVYSSVVKYILWVKEIETNPNFYSLPAEA